MTQEKKKNREKKKKRGKGMIDSTQSAKKKKKHFTHFTPIEKRKRIHLSRRAARISDIERGYL